MSTSTGPVPPPPPPPPAAQPAALVCPNCKAASPQGTRFCPQCGTALGGASSGTTAAGSTPVDIRQKVDADRGVLKKLQMLVPGYRGYRQDEDIREADSILRREVADKLQGVMARLGRLREALTQKHLYAGLTDYAPVLSDVTVLEGRIRHAEMGYSGISAPIRVRTADLDRLYEYDYGFVMAGDQLANEMGPLEDAVGAGDAARTASEIDRLRGLIGQLRKAFEARMTTIEGIKV